MKDKPKAVERDVCPRPEHRFSREKIGMTDRESTPDFPTMDEAPPDAPNVVVGRGPGDGDRIFGLLRDPPQELVERHLQDY